MKRIIFFGLLVVTTTPLICMVREDRELSETEKCTMELEKSLAEKKAKFDQLIRSFTPEQRTTFIEFLNYMQEPAEARGN